MRKRRSDYIVDRVCTVEGCGKEIEARRLCIKHYKRFIRYGSPHIQRHATAGEPLAYLRKMLREPPTDECVLWPYATGKDGYGAVWLDGIVQKVHVIACIEKYGSAPSEDHEVCHSCDNRPCFNKRHVRWGTRQDNVDDMWKRGRAHWQNV